MLESVALDRIAAALRASRGFAAKRDIAAAVARLRASGVAAYKLPERLEILDALPTTASGKVQKHEIVRALTGEPAMGA